MSTLHAAAAEPNPGMNLAWLDALLAYLGARLSLEDLAEAESLLHAALSPAHAVSRREEAARLWRSFCHDAPVEIEARLTAAEIENAIDAIARGDAVRVGPGAAPSAIIEIVNPVKGERT